MVSCDCLTCNAPQHWRAGNELPPCPAQFLLTHCACLPHSLYWLYLPFNQPTPLYGSFPASTLSLPSSTSISTATPPQLLPKCSGSLGFCPGPSLADFTYAQSFNHLRYVNYLQLIFPPKFSPDIHAQEFHLDVLLAWLSTCAFKPMSLPENASCVEVWSESLTACSRQCLAPMAQLQTLGKIADSTWAQRHMPSFSSSFGPSPQSVGNSILCIWDDSRSQFMKVLPLLGYPTQCMGGTFFPKLATFLSYVPPSRAISMQLSSVSFISPDTVLSLHPTAWSRLRHLYLLTAPDSFLYSPLSSLSSCFPKAQHVSCLHTFHDFQLFVSKARIQSGPLQWLFNCLSITPLSTQASSHP